MGCCFSTSADASGAFSSSKREQPSPSCDVPADWPPNGNVLFANLRHRCEELSLDATDEVLVQALSLAAYHAGRALGRVKTLREAPPKVAPEAPAEAPAEAPGGEPEKRTSVRRRFQPASSRIWGGSQKSKGSNSRKSKESNRSTWSSMQREAHDELADADLDLSKAEQRCGRPATAARVHVAPARNLDLDYDLAGRDVLGEGASGKVLKGKCRNTGVLVAVKSLEIPPLDRQEVQDCVGEAQIFLALDHPHVVRLVDVYISQHRVDLVMELMGGGDLFDLLSRRGALPESEAVDATTQILEALTYLHSSNVAHCDMKLENCLFASSRCQHLKLADFGFSQCFKDKAELKRWAGTYGYMSPELLQGDYTESCDMWAVGVIVVALLTDAMPFPPKDEDLEAKIAAVQWDESRARVAALSKEALAFVEGLLIPHVDGRLSASQALQHPWIARHARKSGADAIDESIVASLRAYKEASHFRQACWSVMAWALSHDERETVREAFLAFDLGRTGTVLLREMRSVLTERGLSPREAEDIFRALDLEGNNRVGYSDFLASMCAAKIPLEERHVQEVFRRFDYDNTGRVTERCLHHLFQTPMDDVHVNRYFAEVVGTEGLHLSQLEAVLRRGGEIEKSASVQQMRPSPGPEELDRDESCRI